MRRFFDFAVTLLMIVSGLSASPASAASSTFAVTGNGPQAIAIDSANNIYVTNILDDTSVTLCRSKSLQKEM